MNFKAEDEKTKNENKVNYDRLENYKTREKQFSPEPQEKRKTTVREEKNVNVNS